MDTLTRYLRSHKGYARLRDLKAEGIHTRAVRMLMQSGRIVKVKPGLYRLADLEPNESQGLVEICLAMPKAVICLSSALAFHDLTTYLPPTVSYAIPRSDKPIRLAYPPAKTYFFSENQYHAGIEQHDTTAGTIRVYGPEKTVCDLFRYRHTLGEDLALEGLKSYLKRRDRDLRKLQRAARVCRVQRIVSQYAKAITG